MTVREDKFGQSWLFPPRIADFIPEDHCCNLVVAVVERVDVRLAEQRYLSRPGNPAYPRRMLRSMAYGHHEKSTSLRTRMWSICT
jgi:transposase